MRVDDIRPWVQAPEVLEAAALCSAIASCGDVHTGYVAVASVYAASLALDVTFSAYDLAMKTFRCAECSRLPPTNVRWALACSMLRNGEVMP